MGSSVCGGGGGGGPSPGSISMKTSRCKKVACPGSSMNFSSIIFREYGLGLRLHSGSSLGLGLQGCRFSGLGLSGFTKVDSSRKLHRSYQPLP